MSEKVDIEINSNLDEAAEGAKDLKEGLEGAGEATENLDKATKKGAQGVKKLSVGFGSLAKATGIVALLNKAFEIFQEVLGRNQTVVNIMNTAMEMLNIMFSDLFSFLSNNIGTVIGYFKDLFENPGEKIEEFGNSIKRNLIERFNSFLEVVGFLSSAVKKVFEGDFLGALDDVKEAGKETVDVFTGVDDTIGKVSNVVENVTTAVIDYTTNTYKAAKANVELRNTAELAATQIQGLIEKYDREAELLRQTRDDERKTFAERIEANKKLGEVLKKQEEEMLKLADLRIKAAKIDRDQNKGNIEFEKAYQEALNERAAVQAQITGFKSEQLVNEAGLQKELLEIQNEIRQEGLSGIERELLELENSYFEKLRMAEKAGMDTVAITEQYEKQKSQIVAENTATQLAAYSGLAGNLSKLAGENKALAVAQAVIDTYAGANKAFRQGGTIGFITAAGVIAAGLNNVRQIMKQDVGSGTGGAVNMDSPTEMVPQTTGAFELTGMKPEPVKAFVVESEITDSQAQMADINRRSTI